MTIILMVVASLTRVSIFVVSMILGAWLCKYVAAICWPELLCHCTQRRLQLLRKEVITSLLIGGDLRLRCRFSVQHSSWLASCKLKADFVWSRKVANPNLIRGIPESVILRFTCLIRSILSVTCAVKLLATTRVLFPRDIKRTTTHNMKTMIVVCSYVLTVLSTAT